MKEQEIAFWKACGLEVLEQATRFEHQALYREDPSDGWKHLGGLKIDLPNLFRYAVPKGEITEVNITLASNAVSIDLEDGKGDFYEAHIYTESYEESVEKTADCLKDAIWKVINPKSVEV